MKRAWTGIYSISCEENDQIYIGQAVDIKQRWRQHIADLKAGTHHNAGLQADWSKYGKNAFCFCVEEECRREELDELEADMIELFGTYNAETWDAATLSVNINGTSEVKAAPSGNTSLGKSKSMSVKLEMNPEGMEDFFSDTIRKIDEIVEANPAVLDNPNLLDTLDLEEYDPALIQSLKNGLLEELAQ